MRDQYERQIDVYVEQILNLRQLLFGRRSEKLPVDTDTVQLPLFDMPEDEKVCGCGCSLSRIGEEVSEQLDIIPAKIQVIRQIRPKYACRQCEGIEDAQPVRIIPKSIATPGLVAHVLTGKFVDHLPFYRQEKMFARLGVDIGRATLCNWAMQAATTCLPLINLISDAILESRVIRLMATVATIFSTTGRRCAMPVAWPTCVENSWT